MTNKDYNVGDSYPFKVKSVFGNYCELIDEKNTVVYLQHTNNLRINKGQILYCKVMSNKYKHLKIELLNYEEVVQRESRIDEKVLTRILGEMNISWSTRDFVKLVLTDENDLSFERLCHQWIETQIEMQQDLSLIRSDCRNILELSNLLDSASYEERETYQQRFTTIIELVGYYIFAKDLLEVTDEESEGSAQRFIESLILKLKTSGYLFHPTKNFNILSSLFVLKPSLMRGNIEAMFSVIKQRDIIQWMKEPFRSALINVLEMYVEGNEKLIDKTRDRDKALLLYNTMQALAIQLLLHDMKNGDTDIIDYRVNASRLCNLVSYANMANNIEIVNLALYNLLNSEVALPPYSLLTVGTDRFPFFIADKASKVKDKIDTVSTFTRNNVRLTISGKGIELSSTADNVKTTLPKTLNLWNNLQVSLESKPESGLTGVRKGILRYKNLWNTIERDLFESTMAGTSGKRKKKAHKVHDMVNISIMRQDPADDSKFYCNIEDETGGEGFIHVQDIVPYKLLSPSVRHFISDKGNRLIFRAMITDIVDDEYVFSMFEDIRNEANKYYYDDEDIICYVAGNQSGNGGFLPGITKEGISVTIKGLDAVSNLRRGNMIAVRLIGEAKEGFHIEGKALYLVNNQRFNINESFHFLMQEMAVGEVNQKEKEEKDVESDRILDVTYVRQLIYIIDRIATLDNNDNEYIKAYNYLGFARMLCLLISWEEQAAYYKGRMDIILMLHDFAINDRVDEESLEQLESMNAELFSSNIVLQNRFRQLQMVSYIGKTEHNMDLWSASQDADSSIHELASLVLSYNLMTSTNMVSQATDVQNRIKQTLRLKGYESGLKMYGTGTEDKTTEYKTSIVYLADKTVDIPNMQEQMKVILAVIDSFLNTDGGTLYIGVNDSGMGVGLEGDLSNFEFNGDKDKYARTITDAVVGAFGKVIATHVDVKFDPEGEKPVCIVKVTPYRDGVHFNGGWYVRIGSTKRILSKDEFTQYNSSERELIASADDKDKASSSASKTSKEEKGAETEVDEKAEETKAEQGKTEGETSVTVDKVTTEEEPKSVIPTSQIRFNVLEEYQADYRPTVGYLQFLDKGKFKKITDYNWNPELLTLAVYDEDQEGYLILAYENGYFAKVRVDELLRFDDNSSHTRYNDSPLIFASIAHSDDAIMIITEEDKGVKGRFMLRIDSLSKIEEYKLADYGDRFFNEGMARRIVQVDIIPAKDKELFKYLIDKDKRTLGFPVKTLSSDLTLGFAKLNMQIRKK